MTLHEIYILEGGEIMIFTKNNNKKIESYTMRLSPAERNRLQEFANSMNMPVSHLIRQAINEMYRRTMIER